jgi:hypothetical protein
VPTLRHFGAEEQRRLTAPANPVNLAWPAESSAQGFDLPSLSLQELRELAIRGQAAESAWLRDGRYRDRTSDLLLVRQALSQLS